MINLNLNPQDKLPQADIERGLDYLLLDGVCSQSMSSLTSSAFLIAYALMFHASNIVIGILTAIPFLANLMQLVSTWIIENIHKRKIVSVVSSFLGRVALFFIALTPIFFHNYEIIALLLFVTILNIFGALSNGAFNSWMKDFVPEKIRGRYFAKRSRISVSVATLLSILAAIYIDGLFIGTLNESLIQKYSVLFMAAFILGIIGIIFLSKIPEPKMNSNGKFHIKDLTRPFADQGFKKLLIFMFVWSFAYNLSTPFFVVYMLKRLALSIIFVISVTALGQFITVLMLPLWGSFVDKFGIRPVMKLSAIFYLVALALWPYTTLPEGYVLTIPIIISIYILIGFSTGGLMLSSTVFAFKMAPKDNSVPFITVNGTVISIAAGISPLFGGTISDILDKMRLSLVFMWTDTNMPFTLFLTDFQGLDFLFILSIIIGTYSLYLLKDVPEKDVAEDEIVKFELYYTLRRYFRVYFLHLPILIHKNKRKIKRKNNYAFYRN